MDVLPAGAAGAGADAGAAAAVLSLEAGLESPVFASEVEPLGVGSDLAAPLPA